jgi:hypothetical protein
MGVYAARPQEFEAAGLPAVRSIKRVRFTASKCDSAAVGASMTEYSSRKTERRHRIALNRK